MLNFGLGGGPALNDALALGAAAFAIAPFRIGVNYQDINTVATNVGNFRTMLGAPVGTTAFFGQNSFTLAQCLTDGADKVAKLAGIGEGIYQFNPAMTVNGVPLSEFNAGLHDDYIDGMADICLSAPADNRGERIVRLGWECLDPSHPWNCGDGTNSEADYVAAFQRWQTRFAAKSSTFRFFYCINVAQPVATSYWTTAYPGNSYVDYIGGDLYHITRSDGLPNLTADVCDGWFYKWQTLVNNLQLMISFARTNSKKVILGETGQDNTYSSYFLNMKWKMIRDNIDIFAQLIEWDKDIPTPPTQQFLMKQSENQYPKVYTTYGLQGGPALSVSGPFAYKASQAHSTVIPLFTNKFGKMYRWEIVGDAPTGFSISTFSQSLIIGPSAALGPTTVRVRATDEFLNRGEADIVVTVQAGALADWTPSAWYGSSLKAWWDVGIFASLVISGGKASAWNDLTGNLHHFTQATGSNQLAYSATARNGKPGLTTTPANFTNMAMTSPAGLPYADQARTIFGQMYVNGPASGFQSLFGWCDASAASAGLYESANGIFHASLVPSGHKTSFYSTVAQDLSFISEQKLAESLGGHAYCRQSCNGDVLAEQEIITNALTPAVMRIGGQPTLTSVTGARMDGVIQEFGVLDRSLTDLERSLHDGYEALKWATLASRDARHPFKTIAPKLIV